MITYRCDRCGTETSPDKLYEVELIFTPRDLDGGLDPDKEDRKTLGDLCATCTDLIEPQVQRLVKEIGTTLLTTMGSPSVGWGDKREKSD